MHRVRRRSPCVNITCNYVCKAANKLTNRPFTFHIRLHSSSDYNRLNLRKGSGNYHYPHSPVTTRREVLSRFNPLAMPHENPCVQPDSIQGHMVEKVFAEPSDHTGKIPLVIVQSFADLCLMHPKFHFYTRCTGYAIFKLLCAALYPIKHPFLLDIMNIFANFTLIVFIKNVDHRRSLTGLVHLHMQRRNMMAGYIFDNKFSDPIAKRMSSLSSRFKTSEETRPSTEEVWRSCSSTKA